ncbi:MAG: hypothetical protein KGH54_01360 [Candidatus Micrarchaeota archaeon]|nr:hypothetical protein [Candidatus Micrarchaeota archaeon]
MNEEKLSKIVSQLHGSDYAILDKINTSPGVLKNGLVFGGVNKLIKNKLVTVSIEPHVDQETLFLAPTGMMVLSFINTHKRLRAKLISEAMDSYLDFRENADLGENLRKAFRRYASS